jgi:hypothetical protein
MGKRKIEAKGEQRKEQLCRRLVQNQAEPTLSQPHQNDIAHYQAL